MRLHFSIVLGIMICGVGLLNADPPPKGFAVDPRDDVPLYRISDFLGYRKTTTTPIKDRIRETYTPPLVIDKWLAEDVRPKNPNTVRHRIKDDGAEELLSSFSIKGYIEETKDGKSHDYPPCLDSAVVTKDAKLATRIETVEMSFTNREKVRLNNVVQFNFFDYISLDQKVERSRQPMDVRFGRVGTFSLPPGEFDKAKGMALAEATRKGALDSPESQSYRKFVLMGPVPAYIPKPVFEGQPFWFSKMEAVKLGAELPLGHDFPGTDTDPLVAWTAEAVEGAEYFDVLIDDKRSNEGTAGPAPKVTQENKSNYIVVRLKQKKQLQVLQALRVRVSAELQLEGNAIDLAEPLGSFEIVFQYVGR